MGQGVSCSTNSSVGSTHFLDDLSVSGLVPKGSAGVVDGIPAAKNRRATGAYRCPPTDPDDLSVSVLVHTLVKRRCRSEPLPSFEPAARSVSQQKR